MRPASRGAPPSPPAHPARARAQRQEDGHNRLKRVILIGDHHQLPPVVKNQAIQQYSRLDQSLFTRFIRLGTPYIELNAQVGRRLAAGWRWWRWGGGWWGGAAGVTGGRMVGAGCSAAGGRARARCPRARAAAEAATPSPNPPSRPPAQGRARPSLAALYNWRYRALGDLPNVTTAPAFRAANPGFALPFQLVDVPDYGGRGESCPLPYFYQVGARCRGRWRRLPLRALAAAACRGLPLPTRGEPALRVGGRCGRPSACPSAPPTHTGTYTHPPGRPRPPQNLGEAEYLVSVYQYMRLLGYPAHKISVLTTYNGQKALLRDVFERRCAHHPAFGRPAKVRRGRKRGPPPPPPLQGAALRTPKAAGGTGSCTALRVHCLPCPSAHC